MGEEVTALVGVTRVACIGEGAVLEAEMGAGIVVAETVMEAGVGVAVHWVNTSISTMAIINE